jgi:hypothetical protein
MPDFLHFNTDLYEKYAEASSLFHEGNFPEATQLVEEILNQKEDIFPALLLAGDLYYMMGKDSMAQKKYAKAVMLFPHKSEGYARLAELNYHKGKYTHAAARIIEAIMVYPQHAYWRFLEMVLQKTGREFNRQWIRREVFPATTSRVFEEIVAKEKTPWWHYQAAKMDVYGYFDTKGIGRPNEKTNERYLEVYTWKRMLDKTGFDKFLFARAMNLIGYLDCYVLISLFHHDVYGQFADLVKRNPEKVKKYFYILINWEEKKFDKLREKAKRPFVNYEDESEYVK